MFTNVEGIEASSINAQSDLRPGIYSEEQSIYGNSDDTMEVMIRSFTLKDDEGFSVLDCILMDKVKDEVLFQDFIQLESGIWRSGDGREASTINELLPAEISDLRLMVELFRGDVIEVPGEQR